MIATTFGEQSGFKTADFEVAGSTSENYKSLVLKAGDVATGVDKCPDWRDNDIWQF